MIISCALELALKTPLQDVSMLRVAKELGVTPALLYYYLGSRNALTSGVMNAFYKRVMEEWPASVGDWKLDLERVASVMYRAYVKYAGIASYVVSHNKFRLVQLVEKGEVDYGFLVFEKSVAAVRMAGFGPMRTGLYAHLIMEFVSAHAHASVRHRWPGEHREFLREVIARLDPEKYPSAHFVLDSYVQLKAVDAFSEGLLALINGLESERVPVVSSADRRLDPPRASAE
jgi:AcrR family transcriptional regulator